MMVTKYIDLDFVVKDQKKGKKKRQRPNAPIRSNNNPNNNNSNNISNANVMFKDDNNNCSNNSKCDNDNDNNKKKNDDNIDQVGVPTPRRSYPPLSLKRLPQHPSTKIKAEKLEKWVINTNVDRQMLLLEQDLEISNKRKDKWGKEQKNSCLSPRANSNNNNFGTRVRKDPNTSGPILYNRPKIMENGIHDKKWNKDTELIDKEARAKPQQKHDRGHESFQNLQKQLKSIKKIDDSIQILRNSSLIIRTESTIFD